jgi:hypothetical protein
MIEAAKSKHGVPLETSIPDGAVSLESQSRPLKPRIFVCLIVALEAGPTHVAKAPQ